MSDEGALALIEVQPEACVYLLGYRRELTVLRRMHPDAGYRTWPSPGESVPGVDAELSADAMDYRRDSIPVVHTARTVTQMNAGAQQGYAHS
jgi:hypothetical protein